MKNIRSILNLFIYLFLFLNIAVILAWDQPGSREQEKVFRAGASITNITPFLGLEIIGGWNSPPATHVHDELHVRCLVMDDGETMLALVVADNLGLGRELIEEARRIIQNETGLPPENVLISATHTHSGVSAQGRGERRRGWNEGGSFDAYQEVVIRRIADGVRIAINNLEPAQVGWGSCMVPRHVFVRRWKMKPGTDIPNPFGGQDKVVMNPGRNNPNLLEPAGQPDPEVVFLSLRSADGRPIALLANYSLHYVGGVPAGHISADYFGVFSDRIQELLGADRQNPSFVGILTNGTSGDVNNINFRGPAESHPPYGKMRIVADDVAREVLKAYGSVDHHDWVELKSAQEELGLAVRIPDRDMVSRARDILARHDSIQPGHRHERVYARRTVQMLEWPDTIDIIMQTFRVGDLGIAAIPFETFAETGLELKERSPFEKTFAISMANGSYGYLPTPEQHVLGGYETWLGTNRVEKEASRKIVSKLLDLFARIR